MKKVRKNSFEKMCDRFEENYVSNENEIEYVKKHLYPIKEDKDMLLKIKAEALEDDYMTGMSAVIAMVALVVAVIDLCFTMLSWIEMPAILGLCLIYSVPLLVYFVIIKRNMRYFRNVNKWRQYILVGVDEMMNEQNKRTKKKKKRKKGTKCK